MADNQNPTASNARSRRANQRYRRGAHNIELNANALTQHFARKDRTHQSPVANLVSLTISNYHLAPLGARRIYDVILPPSHDRADLTADPIYFYHPSARQDPQSPLSIQPTAPITTPVLIENYYISGVYSTNPRNESNLYVYIYLPSDYNTVNEVLNLLITQLISMQAAGYPTSIIGMI
jgi:hypothetical protein